MTTEEKRAGKTPKGGDMDPIVFIIARTITVVAIIWCAELAAETALAIWG